MPKTHRTTGQDKFLRTIRNLEAVQYRIRSGVLTGRNTPPNQTRYIADLWQLVRDDDSVAEMLDHDDKLAHRFNTAERRTVGLPVA